MLAIVVFFLPDRMLACLRDSPANFIASTCYRKQSYLNTSTSRDEFLKVLERTRLRYQFLVFGFVVMSNHIHLLISEPQPDIIAAANGYLSPGNGKDALCAIKPLSTPHTWRTNGASL
jgi:hypothetical protein